MTHWVRFERDRVVGFGRLNGGVIEEFDGDISCGTGPGALPMKPGSTIDVIIDGIGRLENTFQM